MWSPSCNRRRTTTGADPRRRPCDQVKRPEKPTTPGTTTQNVATLQTRRTCMKLALARPLANSLDAVPARITRSSPTRCPVRPRFRFPGEDLGCLKAVVFSARPKLWVGDQRWAAPIATAKTSGDDPSGRTRRMGMSNCGPWPLPLIQLPSDTGRSRDGHDWLLPAFFREEIGRR
jgi:hypothetical protein